MLAPLWLVLAEDRRRCDQLPGPGVAGAIDSVQRALYVAWRSALAAVVGIRWRRASAPGGGPMLPSLAGAV